ncbi:MAG: ATP-binding protein [Caldilinea sp. CFX5]|nr:ATP-binding protein [Caldilinea sp. CFX5]
MNKPTTVILITGHPATGKTTLAHYLAQELTLPLLWRDGLKEKLADTLGWSTEEWSLKLGAATWELLYHLVESLLRANISHIVESNFTPTYATPRWQQLMVRYPLRIIQVRCEADPLIVAQRHQARHEHGERHPIHRYDSNINAYAAYLQQQGPLDWIGVESERIEVDTGKLALGDYSIVSTQIRTYLKEEIS